MNSAGGDSDDTRQGATFFVEYVYREVALSERAVSQFAKRVAAPTLDTADRGDGTAVATSCSYGSHAAIQPYHIHGGIRLVCPTTISQLASAIESPTLDITCQGNGASMHECGGDHGYSRFQNHDIDRCRAAVPSPVSKVP